MYIDVNNLYGTSIMKNICTPLRFSDHEVESSMTSGTKECTVTSPEYRHLDSSSEHNVYKQRLKEKCYNLLENPETSTVR